MKPFGIFLIIYIIFRLSKLKSNKDKYIELLILTIIIENFINVGYFIKISSFELLYSEFMLILLGCLSMVILFKNKFNKRVFFIGASFISSIVISNMLLVISPYDTPIITFGMGWDNYFKGIMVLPQISMQTFKMTIRLIIYVIVGLTTVSIINEAHVNMMLKKFVKFGMFVSWFGVIEFIIKNVFKSSIINNLNSYIFGLGDWTVESLLERSNTFALQGFRREPAHFAASMFILGLVLILSSRQSKLLLNKLILVCSVMFFSRSFSAIMYFAVLFGIYAVVNKKKLLYSLIAILLLPFIIFSKYFTYYSERLGNILDLFVTSNYNQTMSEHVRIISVIENFNILLNRPLFGIGVGTSYAHGFIPTLFANIGVIGFILWASFIFKGIANVKTSLTDYIIIMLLLLGWTFTGSIANAYSMSLLLVALIILFRIHSDYSKSLSY